EVKTIEPIVFIDFRPLDIGAHGKAITHYAIGVNKSFYTTEMFKGFNGEGFVIKEGIGEVDWVPYDVELKIYYVEYNNEKVILNYEELN
ncbi:MAG: hypothetical protein IJH34_14390, partial [Romboutsia sp.]|nr:hypothetical protein [Romboutsia sp.]